MRYRGAVATDMARRFTVARLSQHRCGTDDVVLTGAFTHIVDINYVRSRYAAVCADPILPVVS